MPDAPRHERDLTHQLADGDDVPEGVEEISQDELPPGTITAATEGAPE